MRQSGKSTRAIKSAIEQVIKGRNVVYCVNNHYNISYYRNIALDLIQPKRVELNGTRLFYTDNNFLTFTSINNDYNRFRGIRNLKVDFDHYIFQSPEIRYEQIKEWDTLNLYLR